MQLATYYRRTSTRVLAIIQMLIFNSFCWQSKQQHTQKRQRQRRKAAWSRYEWHVETQLVQQIPCLICGNNAAYKKIKFAVDIRGIPSIPPYGFEFELAEVTIKLYDLFYGQPRTLLLLKGTPT